MIWNSNIICQWLGLLRIYLETGEIIPKCYNAHMLPDLELGDILKLRKPHPCGEDRWKVIRLGADIKIECLGCGRQVMLPRRKLARNVKSNLSQEDKAQ